MKCIIQKSHLNFSYYIALKCLSSTENTLLDKTLKKRCFLFAIAMFIRVDAVTQLPDLREEVCNKHGILWSLRPIYVFFRCIGVAFQLDWYRENRNNLMKWLILLYCCVCFLLDAISQMNLVWFLCQSILYKSSLSSDWNTFHPNWTTAASWNNIIDMANYSIHNFGSHLICLFVVRNKWTDVVDSFLRFDFDGSFLTKLRRITIIGIAYVTISVI